MINNIDKLIEEVKIYIGLFDNVEKITYTINVLNSNLKDFKLKTLYEITEKTNVSYKDVLEKINFTLRNYCLDYFNIGWNLDKKILNIVIYVKNRLCI